MPRRRLVLLGLLPLTFLATACPSVDDKACDDASASMVEALEGHLVEGGHVRFPVVLRPEGGDRVFFSFENRTDDQVSDDDSGHVLTLVAPSAGSVDFEAVDERAREETDYPGAAIDVRADGAVLSRGCVVAKRQAS